jgi:hypothetical protein
MPSVDWNRQKWVKTTHTLMTVGVIAALVVGEWPVAVTLAPTTGRRPP